MIYCDIYQRALIKIIVKYCFSNHFIMFRGNNVFFDLKCYPINVDLTDYTNTLIKTQKQFKIFEIYE